MLNALWNPTTVGDIPLPHRLAMSPMTRSRATPDGVPTELNAEYYAQRASHALIITEGTQPSADGQGYPVTPGIYTDEHITGWRKVTDAVHKADGRIVIQLMHAGRISHPDNTPHHRQPVAPSAIKPTGTTFTASGLQEMPVPRALSTEEVAATVDDFRRAAAAAIAAGADGVEIHGANGYLVHQFLFPSANQRTDQYGGSLDNRIRFAVEVATAVADEIGADRTGLRIGPGNPRNLNDLSESDSHELYPHLLRAVAPLNLAYLQTGAGDEELLPTLRKLWPTTLILNRAGTDIATRAKDIEDGLADVITVGSMALANPDLVERVRTGAPLNTPDPATFYGGGAAGYTDYPTHTA
ncbi:alkene reductase [Streptomyces plumbiresistens]|uniref:Alkene reductase n=1 Tax=Streptomyces plumbiresistens TaxID=511811 RepID=A0ABP7TD11_9ACTN